MSNFVKFNSIDQLRHFVKDMEYHGKEVVNLTGTVKIHGTNSAIGYDIQTKELFVQSRNNIITVEKDNAGFAMYVKDFPFAPILFRKRKDSEQSFLHLFNLQSDPYKRDLLEKIKNTI